MIARSRVMHNVFEKIKLAAPVRRHRAHHRRERHRQGAGRARHPPPLAARRAGRSSRCTPAPSRASSSPRELFGHERGSFTGAIDRKEGKFELAEGGTIFLDEISTMDERTQINLLRVLETFTYMRVGGKKERQANVRVVAATNRDLLQDGARSGDFREDLYYRLNILHDRRCRRCASGARTSRSWPPSSCADFAAHYQKPVHVDPAGDRSVCSRATPGRATSASCATSSSRRCCWRAGATLEPELLPQMIYRAGPPEEVIRIPLGATMREAERARGETVVNNDSKTDPRTAADYTRSYEPNGERSYVAFPLLREGQWVASLWASDDKPRQWTKEEVTLIQSVGERTWTAIEKLRAEEERERLLHSEQEARDVAEKANQTQR